MLERPRSVGGAGAMKQCDIADGHDTIACARGYQLARDVGDKSYSSVVNIEPCDGRDSIYESANPIFVAQW
jgi:hypothetical protein